MVAAIVRMAKERPFVFVSYVREDYPIVSKFVTALRSHGIGVWIDVDALKPGEMWKHSIEDALERAKALLIFVSRKSVASAWVQRELEIMIERSEMLVIPVILEQVEELPSALMERQWLLLTDASHERIEESAATLARQLRAQPLSSSHLSKPRLDAITDWALHKARGFVSSPSELPSVTATDSRGVLPVVPDLEPPAAAPGRTTASPSNTFQSIFIVHGHDVALFDDVFQYLTKLKLEPVVLSRIGGAQQSLFQKFMNSAGDARFAVVLISSDDLGASRIQYESPDVGERSLQYRARQNVIFELGFFYGRLGWENVFVVYKPPERVFPNFEQPSDLLGTVFDHVDDSGSWRRSLADRLAAAGFDLTKSAAEVA